MRCFHLVNGKCSPGIPVSLDGIIEVGHKQGHVSWHPQIDGNRLMAVKPIKTNFLTLIPSSAPSTEDALVLIEQKYFENVADIDISVSGGAKLWLFDIFSQVKFLQETHYIEQSVTAIVAMPKGSSVALNYRHTKVRKLNWFWYYFGDRRMVATKHTFQDSFHFRSFDNLDGPLFLVERSGEIIAQTIV